MAIDPAAVVIRPLAPRDLGAWCSFCCALFTDCTAADARDDFAFYLAGGDAVAFVAEAGGGLVGFVLIELRSYAEGCGRGPVPHVEGWYVLPEAQRLGVGRRLMDAAEAWAVERGFREMASDCLIDNAVSLSAHTALGFEEVERAIHFRKALPPRA